MCPLDLILILSIVVSVDKVFERWNEHYQHVDPVDPRTCYTQCPQLDTAANAAPGISRNTAPAPIYKSFCMDHSVLTMGAVS